MFLTKVTFFKVLRLLPGISLYSVGQLIAVKGIIKQLVRLYGEIWYSQQSIDDMISEYPQFHPYFSLFFCFFFSEPHRHFLKLNYCLWIPSSCIPSLRFRLLFKFAPCFRNSYQALTLSVPNIQFMLRVRLGVGRVLVNRALYCIIPHLVF